jgi:formylglycine-generating enzyme required for sulfatase activity
MFRKLYIVLPLILIFQGCSQKEVCKSPEVLDFNNDTMSFIKGGEFLMGDYIDNFGDKMPREVFVDSFMIDRTEVTNGAYRAYLKEKTCKAQTPKYIDDPILGVDELPVVSVSHKDAQDYCKFYGKRLPTEAEWEFAARGNLELKKFPWGNEEDPNLMNFRDSNNTWAVPVKSYIPNGYQLFDMTGNVREWVEDSYEKKFYKNACINDPFIIADDLPFLSKTIDWAKEKISAVTNFGAESIYKSNCYKNPVNRKNIPLKVNRGGSWEYSEGYPANVSFRTFDDENTRSRDLGFRCAIGSEKESFVGQQLRELINGKDG